MKKALLGLAVLVAMLYLALCVALFVFQRSFLYFPTPPGPSVGAGLISIPQDGARVLVTTREQPGRKALLYFGGNAEDVSRSASTIARAFPDRAIYLLHYRGYGGSTGEPSEAALVTDALALYDKVVKDHPGIAIVGRSLGSGIAIQVASQRQVERLVLVTPYDSIQQMAATLFPFLPVRWLLRDKYESWRFAPRIKTPTLIVAAEHDEVIPRERTEELARHFPKGVATLETVRAAGHNTISESPQYVSLLAGR